MGNPVSWGLQPSIITDPGDAGAIPTTEGWGSCMLTTGGAETRTLAIPQRQGQRLTLGFDTDGGACVITVAAAVGPGTENTLTFEDAHDHITLEAITVGGALRWCVASNVGVTLSTV